MNAECPNSDDLYSHEGAVCPHCGYVNLASNSDGLLYDESTVEYDCADCGRRFVVSVSVSHAWSTSL